MEKDNFLFPPFTDSQEQPILKYSIQAPKIETKEGLAEICLIPQISGDEVLKGRFVSNEEFKAVTSEDVFKAIPENETVNLKQVQIYDKRAQPFIREIVVEVVNGLTFLKQKKQKIKIVIVDRFNNKTVREISGILDDETNFFHYAVNEQITFNKTVNYGVVSAMKLNFSIVYQ